MPLADILSQVVQLATRNSQRIRNLIVITGGEPFLQPIGGLCEALVKAGFKVQLETNGTLYRQIPDEVDIICSPKNNGKGYFPIRPDLLARVTALKFIISAQNKDYAGIGDVGQGNALPVYVQPMDEYDAEKNKANLELATRLAMENGYRLSLQMHKIAGIE
jgi:organic radical activating enzyme